MISSSTPPAAAAAAIAVAMGVVKIGKKRRLEEEEDLVDRISLLPDDVLGDIVSLLPTKAGARTQLLSSRWRHLWRSAPLNVDLRDGPWRRADGGDISRVLAAHPGPGRRLHINYSRLSVSYSPIDAAAAILDGWVRSPALDNLRELEILFVHGVATPPLPLPPSALRFSSTLTAASFDACLFPDCGSNNAIAMPLLKRLTLLHVRISEASLHAMLAGCHVLESLLLLNNEGYPRLKIASPSLRSIGVGSSWGDGDLRLQQIVVEDAPCLERLLFIETFIAIDIWIVSAPRLSILGELIGKCHKIRFGTAALQGSIVNNLTTVVPGLRVLALSYVKLDGVINLLRCFPNLERLYIQRTHIEERDASHNKYWKLAGNLDIRLKKIVLSYYEDCKSDINFAKFFVRNASRLESMRLEVQFVNVGDDACIRRQHKLFQVEKRASRGARFDFVSSDESIRLDPEEQVHDLSILDPFHRIQ